LDAGADYAEVSLPIFEKLGTGILPDRTVLRLPDRAAVRGYAAEEGGNGSVRNASFLLVPDDRGGVEEKKKKGLINEVSIQGALLFDPAYPFKRCFSYRITGLDDLLLYDYPAVFKRLKFLAGNLEFCPCNSLGCATALASEWLEAGGRRIVSSFLGKGGFAALEEILMILHISGRPKPAADFSALMELKKSYEAATGEKVDSRKSVIGDEIFHVESGIHVDGILKDPSNYEPFPPELLGRKRTIRLGKHSGQGAVRYKLEERGLVFSGGETEALLKLVREESQNLGRGITEAEFSLLAGAFADKGGVYKG
jgi:homocitrate synthase NifV